MMQSLMNRTFLFISLLFFSFTAIAQFDSNTGSISVPKGNPVTPSAPAVTTPSIFDNEDEPDLPSYVKPYQVGASNNDSFSMYQKDEYVNRSSEYMDRVQVKSKGESNEAFRGNMDFGIIKTKSKHISLIARDFGLEDGDRVKVTVNDKIIVSDVMLTNSGMGIMITLSEGFNDIRIEALNQGTSGPNTADFGLKDDNDDLLARNEWNLATGFYAKFLIIKE